MSDVEDRKMIVDGLLACVERRPRESLPGWIATLEARLGHHELFDSALGAVELIDGSVWGLPFKLSTNAGFGKRLSQFIRMSEEVSRLLFESDGTVGSRALPSGGYRLHLQGLAPRGG